MDWNLASLIIWSFNAGMYSQLSMVRREWYYFLMLLTSISLVVVHTVNA